MSDPSLLVSRTWVQLPSDSITSEILNPVSPITDLDLNVSDVTSSPGWTPSARLYLPRTLKDSPELARFVPHRNTEMLKSL